MSLLVSLDEAKQRLRFDHDVEDETLELMIEGASGAILGYLKLALDYYDDSSGEAADVPAVVKNATLLLVGILSKDRDGTAMKDWMPGYLPPPVVSLLYPLRDPALA